MAVKLERTDSRRADRTWTITTTHGAFVNEILLSDEELRDLVRQAVSTNIVPTPEYRTGYEHGYRDGMAGAILPPWADTRGPDDE